ncbi:hypothetical protein [Methylobacterium gregans]|uniref:Polysaccharide biosynthesis protein n=1 Tax=Methylobacterium gregans TaxID=374424 RepID=A0AA37HRS8_9HYPH|nr:hypothetical protein [Methylobacterium gregans]MDQ0524181.1 O-antigen/teichoic acid export membrane protein [Methylobacterium gregans]GJD80546.1 hypothetical protein NBEOAGPD_3787 [Methylobacterium gregans]GLS56282.1 hypothetical protein GCM10007886_44670 [Methylobacterium gregans]
MRRSWIPGSPASPRNGGWPPGTPRAGPARFRKAGGHAARLAWPLIDQGIASIGTFGLTILLARALPPAEYGVFALLLGGLMILHMVTSSLVFYPLSVRAAAAGPEGGAALMRASLDLLGLLFLPAGAAIALAALAAGRADLILPALAYFLLWQTQEAFRRYLFAELRFAAAIPGDAVSYLGQVALVLWLARDGHLTLGGALCAMALTSGLGALLQAGRAGLGRGGRAAPRLPAILGDFWRLGGWSLANNLLGTLRGQVLFWLLAVLSGAALTAQLQASQNLVNLMNPLVIGLCNIIPQTAARAHARGKAEAWRAARPFALSGVPVALLFFSVLFAAPEPVLRLVYGSASPYLGLAGPVRLLALAAVAAYATDMVCSYFHGVEAARHALVVNAAGTVAVLAAAVPLTLRFGLGGACAAMVLASLVRLLISQLLLRRLIAADAPLPAA